MLLKYCDYQVYNANIIVTAFVIGLDREMCNELRNEVKETIASATSISKSTEIKVDISVIYV